MRNLMLAAAALVCAAGSAPALAYKDGAWPNTWEECDDVGNNPRYDGATHERAVSLCRAWEERHVETIKQMLAVNKQTHVIPQATLERCKQSVYYGNAQFFEDLLHCIMYGY